MSLLKKLSKKDNSNEVTKKDGNLTMRSIEGINHYAHKQEDGKFYPTYTTGSRRNKKIVTNDNIETIIKKLGFKYETGNDAPRGGQTGNFIKVSKSTFIKIKELLKDNQ